MKSDLHRDCHDERKTVEISLCRGLAALLLALPLLYRSASAQPSGQGAAPPAIVRSHTLADQTDLAITVYNSNLALVRDVRQLNLTPGESRLRFMDIAASIIRRRSIFAQ